MKLKAKGICTFHFWGDYSQDFILRFDDEESATLALPILNAVLKDEDLRGMNACGNSVMSKGWIASGRNCVAWLPADPTKAMEAWLETKGADPKKVGSLAYSCDQGEVFDICLEVDDPAQTLIPFTP